MTIKEISAETFSAIENLEEFVNNVDPESDLARVSLEYLVINSKSTLVEALITRLLESSSVESKEWAEVYKIDHLVYKQEMDLIDAIKELTYKMVKAPELSTLIKIFQLYNYSSQKEFEMIASLSELVNVEINMLEEGFMKTSLQCRYLVTMQSVHLHLNDVENSRICGTDIINNALTPTMRAVALTGMGNSFIISDKVKAVECFNKSLNISKEIKHEMLVKEAQKSLNFTYCFWGEPEKVCLNKSSTTLDDKYEYIFYLIKSNQKEKALQLLNQIEIKIENDYIKAFDQYYRGLIMEDRELFNKSSIYFERAGDQYYRQLPINELIKSSKRR
ncbi:AimR family lysis-lysogeny pheromone receptor [Alkalihalobacillus sp. MEB130]|uniref:AimR family lysis-lysogeny pheromone receptor n=1 Tax=Alkalihalobacillus sp. MEB130 TaxID=2976704 RepID=UPI0028DF2970|nr:AimR family lysis-lysogeny pheromone receptor [Alkalihalobacillus sp. MEB130]MDT8860612.1 AimR family lysis-lysogeny pheromone receptor [Alkalihalobacillus sp. MEB130]